MNRIYLGYRYLSAVKVSALISVQLIWNALKSEESNLGLRSPSQLTITALFRVSSFVLSKLVSILQVSTSHITRMKWKCPDRGQNLNGAGPDLTRLTHYDCPGLTVTLKWKTIIQQKLYKPGLQTYYTASAENWLEPRKDFTTKILRAENSVVIWRSPMNFMEFEDLKSHLSKVSSL